jgi:hypothetical protein
MQFQKHNLQKKIDQKITFRVFLREKKTPFWGIFGPFLDDNSIMSPNQSARNYQKV